MERISIKTLNPNILVGNTTTSTLDIKSLITINNLNETNALNFNAEYLIRSNKEKREKILKIYMRFYNQCIEKIKLVHNSNKTDIIFDVPESVMENIEYVPKYCMDFIETKLKQNYFDTYRMNYKTIFITWKYIESSKNNYFNLKNM